MTAADVIAEWDSKYERVNTEDRLVLDRECMFDRLRSSLQRRPFGSYKVCCVLTPFSTYDYDDALFDELESVLDGPDFQNIGWIIPAGDPRFDSDDLSLVLY